MFSLIFRLAVVEVTVLVFKVILPTRHCRKGPCCVNAAITQPRWLHQLTLSDRSRTDQQTLRPVVNKIAINGFYCTSDASVMRSILTRAASKQGCF